jgi:spermidine synthase
MASNLPIETSPAAPIAHPLWRPTLIVFVSNFCVMVLELVAGRIVAPYIGVSLYTWTSIIGVVLAGISLGNYLGGKLADRFASLKTLGLIFSLAGLFSFLVLAVDYVGQRGFGSIPLVLNIILLTASLFFVPSTILGMISPIVAKLAISDLSKTGSTLGRIYAAGTVGSIVGTFATGFLLISWLGTHVIVILVGLILLGLGLFLFFGRRWPAALILLAILCVGAKLGYDKYNLRGPCLVETNYFCIKVHEEERDGHPVRVLVLDRLVHSYTSLDDPTELVYGYEQTYARVTATRAEQDDHLRALFIGGGGYTFPRFIEAVYPGSDVDVIEIDPGVTRIAHEKLGLSAETTIRSFNEDARLFMRREPTGKYDLIFGDAFNDFSVPYHLTTLEFAQRVRAWLEPDGLYVVNIIDGEPGDFLRAFANTLQHTFGYVYLASSVRSFKDLPRSTFVLIGTDSPLALEDGTPSYNHREALQLSQVATDEEFAALLATGRAALLTDRYAPVDQMLAKAFRK